MKRRGRSGRSRWGPEAAAAPRSRLPTGLRAALLPRGSFPPAPAESRRGESGVRSREDPSLGVSHTHLPPHPQMRAETGAAVSQLQPPPRSGQPPSLPPSFPPCSASPGAGAPRPRPGAGEGPAARSILPAPPFVLPPALHRPRTVPAPLVLWALPGGRRVSPVMETRGCGSVLGYGFRK